jgi:DNA-binding transcriptional ArsR family regulator
MSNANARSKRITDDESIEGLLKALADEECRQILRELNQAPMSAPELVESRSIARSTVYRKLELLEQIGLVHTGIRLDTTGTHTTEYDTTLSNLRIECAESGFELVVQHDGDDGETGSQDRLARLGSNSVRCRQP